MAKKYTRLSSYNSKEKVYDIYYIDLKGKIKTIGQVESKADARFILSLENEGKSEKTFKPASKKDSRIIEQQNKNKNKIISRVDSLLKKKKLTEKDKIELSYYSDKGYKDDKILDKLRQKYQHKKEIKAREKKQLKKIVQAVYCHTSQPFFYFSRSSLEYIQKTLLPKMDEFSRVMIRYSGGEDFQTIIDTPKDVREIELAFSFLLSTMEVGWTKDEGIFFISGII